KVCFDIAKASLEDKFPGGHCSLGEELLKPTRIYVKEIVEILAKIRVKALFHITGDGLFNLTRTARAVGYRLTSFPQPPAIFEFLRQSGAIPYTEMFRV